MKIEIFPNYVEKLWKKDLLFLIYTEQSKNLFNSKNVSKMFPHCQTKHKINRHQSKYLLVCLAPGCPLVLIFLIFLILPWFGKFGLDLLIFSWYFIKFQEKSWFFVQALWLFHLQIFVSIVFSGNEVFVLNNRASKLYTMYRNVWFAI